MGRGMSVGSGVGVHEGTELVVGAGGRSCLDRSVSDCSHLGQSRISQGQRCAFLPCLQHLQSFLSGSQTVGFWGPKLCAGRVSSPSLILPLAFLSPSCSSPAILGPTGSSALKLFPSSTTSYLWEAQEKRKPDTHVSLWPTASHLQDTEYESILAASQVV